MSVEFTDETGKTIAPAGEPLWRGVTLLRYEKGAGSASDSPTQTVVSSRSRPPGTSPLAR